LPSATAAKPREVSPGVRSAMAVVIARSIDRSAKSDSSLNTRSSRKSPASSPIAKVRE
jgi:hypothetical protein